MKTQFLGTFIFLLFVTQTMLGQVGIGTTAPNSNAALDVTSTNQGLLFPRIALNNTNSTTPLASHVAGMVAYNTATVNNVYPGLYYNDGSRWRRLSPTYYRNYLLQSSGLSIPSNGSFYAVPGLNNVTINVPADGYYQFDFIGFFAAPTIEPPTNYTTAYQGCHSEGYFRVQVDTMEKYAFISSTSTLRDDTVGHFYRFIYLASNVKITFQQYLTAGNHTINVDFFQQDYTIDCNSSETTWVGGLYPNNADMCNLSIHYVGE